jgi:uncharacterized protein
MAEQLDKKRIVIFVLFAFGIAWAVGLLIAVTGGLANSPVLVPGTNLTLALVLLALGYMSAPALANILTRVLTREGRSNLYLQPNLRRGWPYWVLAWFGPAILTILGAALFFAVFPQYFDPELGVVRKMLEAVGQPIPISPWLIVISQTISALIIAPPINSLFTFGEEFGWRAYLLQKLMPLGGRRAMLLMGVIWGAWHWPIIAMGHNYGLGYPGAPWLGMLMMVWFTFITGTFLGWMALRAGSVWPAVIGHAAINGIAGLGILLVQRQPSTLLGPTPVGIVASAAFGLVALAIMLSSRGLAPVQPATLHPAPTA